MRRVFFRDAVQIALCAALMCVCSLIRIPLSVPITLTLFAVYLTLFLLGGLRATLATLVYLAAGLCGAPVFSAAGIGAFVSPTGGFLFGLPLLCLVFALLTHRQRSPKRDALGAAAGTLILYATGTLWYGITTSAPLGTTLLVCVVPFLLPDLAKLLLARLCHARLKRHLR